MKGWHFLRDDGIRRDGVKPEPGGVERHDGPLKMCDSGLHFSARALDALRYADGALCRRIEAGGEIVEGDDKCICRERRELWRIDATNILHEFACVVAERALQRERDAGREPHPDSWRAIEVKRAWLRGEATDEQLDAARAAARFAAVDTARFTAVDTAVAAAVAAAWSAAVATAWCAAWDAAWAEFNALLERMLTEAHEREGA